MDRDTVSARLIRRAVLLVALAVLGFVIVLGTRQSGSPNAEASAESMSLQVYAGSTPSGSSLCDTSMACRPGIRYSANRPAGYGKVGVGSCCAVGS